MNTPMFSPFVCLSAAIAVLVILVAAGAWQFLGANRPAPVASNAPAEPPRLSIVVLPFANLSGDPAQDYLADALTDELTTGIARIRDTFVIAPSTAFTYKGKPIDAKAIGKELGVRYVLEGSVQPGGDRMRVNAQLIDADSGAHLWADQFDAARADLLQMQDEIIARLAQPLAIQLTEVEAARLKRMPAANPGAQDLALQCLAAVRKGGFAGKQAEAGYRLCEQALAADPSNVLAMNLLSGKFWVPVRLGLSTDPNADLKRADKLVSQALALDPNYVSAHMSKANILRIQGRFNEAIAESERALALDQSMVSAYVTMGEVSRQLGQFDKSLEFFDKAIRLSPHDPALDWWYAGKADAHFGLKEYDQAIEWARRSIAIDPNNFPFTHADLIAALALTGHDTEAREALQRFFALPVAGLRTIAAWKANKAQVFNPRGDPHIFQLWDRLIEGLRKAGMPET
jgi:adenylate cyclase